MSRPSRPVHPEHTSFLARTCREVVEALGVDDATVVVSADVSRWDLAHATGPDAVRVEELGFTFGEGPGPDVLARHVPVLAADLGAAAVVARWPLWTPAALDLGYRSAHVLPVQVGTIALGTLGLYARRPRTLGRSEVDLAGRLADAVLVGLLDQRGPPPAVAAGRPGPRPGDPAAELFSAEIYQAAGMVMVQATLSAADALVRVRAHAFGTGRPLREVARDVVARRLRLDDRAGPDDGA